MARTVANLSVSVTARTRGLSRGLKNAKAEVAGFAKGVAKTIAGISAIGVAVGGAVAVGVKNKIQDLSALAKTARTLGNIKPTVLLAIQDLAQQANVEIPALNKGLQFMLRTVQEASTGKGEGITALKQLGLDAQRLVKLRPDEILVKISAAMKEAEKDGLNLSRLTSLFGAKGAAIGNIFESLGKDGLKPFIQEVERTGRAVTDNMLIPIESVEDRWFRLTQRISGMFTKLAVAVAAPLDNALKDLEAFLKEPEQVKAFAGAFKSLADQIGNSSENIKALLKDYDDLKAKALSVKNESAGVGARILQGIGKFLGGAIAQTQENFTNPQSFGIARDTPLYDQGLNDAAEILRPARESLFKWWDSFTDSVSEMADQSSKSIANAVAKSEKAISSTLGSAMNGGSGSSGQVLRLERGGQAIPFGPKLGGDSTGVINELRKQTTAIEKIGYGTNPASLPKGTYIIAKVSG